MSDERRLSLRITATQAGRRLDEVLLEVVEEVDPARLEHRALPLGEELARLRDRRRTRSEEHTSELQSQ